MAPAPPQVAVSSGASADLDAFYVLPNNVAAEHPPRSRARLPRLEPRFAATSSSLNNTEKTALLGGHEQRQNCKCCVVS